MKRTILLSLGFAFLFVVQTSYAGIDAFSTGTTQSIKADEFGVVTSVQVKALNGTLGETIAPIKVKTSLSSSHVPEPSMMLILGTGLLILATRLRKTFK